MVEVFAMVGVSKEIVVDQGSNFVSQLLAELYRLLQVKPIRTSPYQRMGVVEHYNKTSTAMLRTTASEDGKDWAHIFSLHTMKFLSHLQGSLHLSFYIRLGCSRTTRHTHWAPHAGPNQ